MSNRVPQDMQQTAMRALKTSAIKASAVRPITETATSHIGLLAASRFPTGQSPFGDTLTGDFNGDGNKDLLTKVSYYDWDAGQYLFSFSIALGNGDGTFQAPKLTSSGAKSWEMNILVADLNGDHRDDVLAVSSFGWQSPGGLNGGMLEVFLSNGDGTFAPAVTYSNEDYNAPASSSLVDVNGDGKPDVMTVQPDAMVTTMLNNGDGTFSAPTSVPYSGYAWGALIADLDGDGKQDFATILNDAGQVMVYLAATDGGYQEPVQLDRSSESDLCSIAQGDLNGDGRPDLVTSDCEYIQDNITIYLNQGGGVFSAGVSLWGGYVSEGVTVADVNGDGKADIVVSNYDGADVTVLIGNGDGTVQPAVVGYAVGGYPFGAAAIADFNGDAKQDVVVTDYYSNFVYLQGYGDGTFRAAQDYFSPRPADVEGNWPWSISPASGDFNGDGRPDVVVGNCCNPEVGVTVFLTNQDGSLQPGVNYGGDDLQYVAVGDFNGDNNLDIAASSSGAEQGVQVFFGNGDGTFQAPQHYPFGGYSYPTEIVAADFNGDGKLDLGVMTQASGINVLLNDGQGGFLDRAVYPTAGSGTPIAAADVNGDGNLDLIGGGWYKTTVLIGNGDGTFQPAQEFEMSSGVLGIAVADLNADGNNDIVEVLDASNVVVLLGSGDGTFGPEVSYPASSTSVQFYDARPVDVKIADLDRDGNLDLVFVNSSFGTVGVLYGKGDGTFDGPVEFATGGYPYGLTVADMNGDGALDVVTANDDMVGATVLLNAGGTRTEVSVSKNPAMYGEAITMTAAVTPSVKGVTAAPTGNFNFISEDPLGTVDLVNGSATKDLPLFTPGNHPVIAFYSGDSAFIPAPGVAVTITINKASTTTDVVSSANPVITGTPVTFTATVTSDTIGIPTGTVTFMDGTTQLGSGTLDETGKATFSTSTLAIGSRDITAVYAGDTNYTGSTSSVLSEVVINPQPTSVTVTSSANPVITGHSVTFTATVTAQNLTIIAGSPTHRPAAITGTVTFKDGTTTLGTGALDSSGVATFSTSSLVIATHNITAVYGGDVNYAGSTSAVLSQVINPLSATTVALTSSANPVVTTHSVTFTATVTSQTTGTITGTVTFKDGTTTLGTGTLDATGKATLSSTTLTAATHSITAVYGGDANYATSTSTAVAQVVLATAPDYTLTANPTSATIKAGETATFTITATADQYFNGTVTLSCGQLPMGVSCSFTPASLNPTNGHPAQSTLVVTTTSQFAALTAPANPRSGNNALFVLASLSGVGAFGSLLLGDFSKKRRMLMIAVGTLILLMALGMSACGGATRNPNGTPSGAMTVQLSAVGTAGTTGGNTTAHPLALTITIK